MKTNKKLLFFDIDGTLLTEGHSDRYIPDSTLAALRLVQAQEHLCFINTGRAISEIEDSLKDLNMDGYVCGCGTYIEYHNDILYTSSIGSITGQNLIKDMNHWNIEWLLEGKDHIYYNTSPYSSRLGLFHEEHLRLFPDRCVTITGDESGICFDKFCIFVTEHSDFNSFYNKYQTDFSFIDRGNCFYEIVPNGHSKATGIQFLMNHFSLPQSSTIAIGDSANDLPMLEFAGISIAMGHSAAEVKEVVNFITNTVEEDGIFLALKHYGLIS